MAVATARRNTQEREHAAQTTTIARPKYAFLDGIRGVLALTVVLSHGTNQTTGFDPAAPAWMRLLQMLGAFCVPGFIFLSGFCLALPTIRHGFRLDSFWGFFGRRAARLLPAYYAALVSALLAALFVTHTLRVSDVLPFRHHPNIIGPLLLVQDVYGSAPYDSPLWSLAPETHIYFCFPLILWLFRRVSAAQALLLCIAAACIAQHFCVVRGHGSFAYLGGLFSAGVFAAWFVLTGRRMPSENAMQRVAAYSAVLLAAAVFEVGYARFWKMTPLFSGLAGVVLLPVFGLLFQQPGCGLRRILECLPVQFLGRISYSLYLTHWVVLSLVMLLVPLSWPAPIRCAAALMLGLPAGIVAASVFYRLLEHPYLSRSRSQMRPKQTP